MNQQSPFTSHSSGGIIRMGKVCFHCIFNISLSLYYLELENLLFFSHYVYS